MREWFLFDFDTGFSLIRHLLVALHPAIFSNRLLCNIMKWNLTSLFNGCCLTITFFFSRWIRLIGCLLGFWNINFIVRRGYVRRFYLKHVYVLVFCVRVFGDLHVVQFTFDRHDLRIIREELSQNSPSGQLSEPWQGVSVCHCQFYTRSNEDERTNLWTFISVFKWSTVIRFANNKHIV